MKTAGEHGEAKLRLLETRCREHGLPVTTQRRVILTALLEHRDHPTVDQVFEDVKERLPGISRTTVYRVLDTLVRLRIARRTNHFAAAARFDGKTDHHHHLVCIECGKVVDFDGVDLSAIAPPDARQTGFEIIDFSAYFEGFCAECKQRKNLHSLAKSKRGRKTIKGAHAREAGGSR